MKAAVFYDVKDIRLEDVPEPEIGDEDVLVEVTACGICGSDLEYYMGRSPVGTADGKGPLILGHEFAGKVVKVGKDAAGAGRGRPRRGQPDPVERVGRLLALRQPPLRPLGRARRDDERRVREVRPHEGRARATSCPTR